MRKVITFNQQQKQVTSGHPNILGGMAICKQDFPCGPEGSTVRAFEEM